eukprot:COSAG01_NODE_2134_length_8347_cov_43.066319_3_plen_173_part_00
MCCTQVLLSLWTLSSYICDGFADVGTMLGSADVGAGRSIAALSRRLLCLGVGTGALCSALMWAGEAQIMHAFTHEPGVHAELRSAWSVLVLMQPCNAAVFVYDGLMLALQAFAFIRNLMLGATLGMFSPALLLFYAVGVAGIEHTLLAVWVAKCWLNVGRCAGAAWRVSCRG